jgi:hypothetical protein
MRLSCGEEGGLLKQIEYVMLSLLTLRGSRPIWLLRFEVEVNLIVMGDFKNASPQLYLQPASIIISISHSTGDRG